MCSRGYVCMLQLLWREGFFMGGGWVGGGGIRKIVGLHGCFLKGPNLSDATWDLT